MDLSQAALVIVLTITLVVIFNIVIYFSLRGERTTKQIELLRRFAQRARRPWQDEDQQLKELASRVADLKNQEIVESQEESSAYPDA